MGKIIKWTAFFLLTAAAGLSLWLAAWKLSGEAGTLAGCGAGSSCADVLVSKWSVVFGVVPVSLFSFFLHVAVLASLWAGGAGARRLRVLGAWVFLAAAVWFTALQWFVVHAVCPYCMVTHGLAVVAGLLILLAESGTGTPADSRAASPLIAVAMVAGLATLQYFGSEPPTHLLDDAACLPGSARHRLFSGEEGRESYRGHELPRLGPADAGHVVVEYFDYTCGACRDTHGYLGSLVRKYPGKLAVVVLPVPLSRKCNPHLPHGAEDHGNACELAKLSLRVWQADKSRWEEFHAWLFEHPGLPPGTARAMALSLVGEAGMSGVDEQWVDSVLARNVADYGFLARKTPVMPKILLGDSRVIHGKPADEATLEKILGWHPGFGKPRK